MVRERALHNGAAGRRWLDELPARVGALAARWQLEVGAPFAGGTAGFVAPCVRRDGRAVVLKVAMPLDMHESAAFALALRAHRLAAGRGCVELLEADLDEHAMLLERLGPNLADLGLALPELLHAVATTLRSFWRPVDDPTELRSGPEQARWLAGYVVRTWDELGRPCARTVIDRAVEYCERRIAGFEPDRAVLVHGDAHGWNTVAAGDGTYKFVDPEGLWSEPEHDLAVPMREYNGTLLAGDTARLVRERAEQLAGWCGVDAERVWEWGFVERVSTGLANVRDFDGDDGLVFLEVARRCL